VGLICARISLGHVEKSGVGRMERTNPWCLLLIANSLVVSGCNLEILLQREREREGLGEEGQPVGCAGGERFFIF
jgi:hypothetical protein